jgi:serine O-acetyltransferase
MTFKTSEKINTAIKELSEYDLLRGLCHEQVESYSMPSANVLIEIIDLTRAILFPGYFGNASVNRNNLSFHIGLNVEKLHDLLSNQILSGLCFDMQVKAHLTGDCSELPNSSIELHQFKDKAELISSEFVESLPKIRSMLATDVEASFNGDPAAESKEVVIYCYPGIKAISNYRIAHRLLELNVPIIPRMITEMAHSETGIDIHPGADIDSHFAIDHGTGVVIGATSIIGKNVKLYQGVTLGAKSFPMDEEGHPIKGIPRHPILKDNVIVYSNATILGRITIGENATIGGNIWVTDDVAPNARIIQSKAKK